MLYLILLFSFGFPVCPPIKSNIIEFSKEDKKAMQEHSDQCLTTKSFLCLYTFEKKGPGWYASTCGPLLKEK